MTETTKHKPQDKKESSGSFWANTWKEFKKNKLSVISLYMVGILVILAIFADFLAYGKPFYAKYEGETYYPLFYDYLSDVGLYQWDRKLILVDNWHDLDLEASFWPPVRYNSNLTDLKNSQFKGPFEIQDVPDWQDRHFLGTDELGRDVLAGLIHGSRISLTVGIISMGIAGTIGVILGAFAGYFGDTRLRIPRINLVFTFIGIILGYFYGFFLRSEALSQSFSDGMIWILLNFLFSLAIFVGIVAFMNLIARPFSKINFLGKKVPVWLDIMISRVIEVVVSLPTLLLIITISSIAKPSLYNVMIIIGLTSWTGIARLTRGEMLKTRNLEFIQAAQSLGYSEIRTILKHALPNSMAPVFVAIAFGIAVAVLLEAALSFIGIGVPIDMVTWGSLLNQSRQDTSAWWMAIFPGFAIFVTVTIFNLLGEGLRDALDPRTRK